MKFLEQSFFVNVPVRALFEIEIPVFPERSNKGPAIRKPPMKEIRSDQTGEIERNTAHGQA